MTDTQKPRTSEELRAHIEQREAEAVRATLRLADRFAHRFDVLLLANQLTTDHLLEAVESAIVYHGQRYTYSRKPKRYMRVTPEEYAKFHQTVNGLVEEIQSIVADERQAGPISDSVACAALRVAAGRCVGYVVRLQVGE